MRLAYKPIEKPEIIQARILFLQHFKLLELPSSCLGVITTFLSQQSFLACIQTCSVLAKHARCSGSWPVRFMCSSAKNLLKTLKMLAQKTQTKYLVLNESCTHELFVPFYTDPLQNLQNEQRKIRLETQQKMHDVFKNRQILCVALLQLKHLQGIQMHHHNQPMPCLQNLPNLREIKFSFIPKSLLVTTTIGSWIREPLATDLKKSIPTPPAHVTFTRLNVNLLTLASAATTTRFFDNFLLSPETRVNALEQLYLSISPTIMGSVLEICGNSPAIQTRLTRLNLGLRKMPTTFALEVNLDPSVLQPLTKIINLSSFTLTACGSTSTGQTDSVITDQLLEPLADCVHLRHLVLKYLKQITGDFLAVFVKKQHQLKQFEVENLPSLQNTFVNFLYKLPQLAFVICHSPRFDLDLPVIREVQEEKEKQFESFGLLVSYSSLPRFRDITCGIPTRRLVLHVVNMTPEVLVEFAEYMEKESARISCKTLQLHIRGFNSNPPSYSMRGLHSTKEVKALHSLSVCPQITGFSVSFLKLNNIDLDKMTLSYLSQVKINKFEICDTKLVSWPTLNSFVCQHLLELQLLHLAVNDFSISHLQQFEKLLWYLKLNQDPQAKKNKNKKKTKKQKQLRKLHLHCVGSPPLEFLNTLIHLPVSTLTISSNAFPAHLLQIWASEITFEIHKQVKCAELLLIAMDENYQTIQDCSGSHLGLLTSKLWHEAQCSFHLRHKETPEFLDRLKRARQFSRERLDAMSVLVPIGSNMSDDDSAEEGAVDAEEERESDE
jgi:hypothetical protein